MAANAAVDFPQPDSPTRPYASPGAIENETPRKTWRSMPRTVYATSRPRSSSVGVLIVLITQKPRAMHLKLS